MKVRLNFDLFSNKQYSSVVTRENFAEHLCGISDMESHVRYSGRKAVHGNGFSAKMFMNKFLQLIDCYRTESPTGERERTNSVRASGGWRFSMREHNFMVFERYTYTLIEIYQRSCEDLEKVADACAEQVGMLNIFVSFLQGIGITYNAIIIIHGLARIVAVAQF